MVIARSSQDEPAALGEILTLSTKKVCLVFLDCAGVHVSPGGAVPATAAERWIRTALQHRSSKTDIPLQYDASRMLDSSLRGGRNTQNVSDGWPQESSPNKVRRQRHNGYVARDSNSHAERTLDLTSISSTTIILCSRFMFEGPAARRARLIRRR